MVVFVVVGEVAIFVRFFPIYIYICIMLRTSRLGGPLQRCHSCLPFPPITINTTPTTRSHHHHHHHHQMRRRRRGYDEIFSYRLNQRNRMSYPNLLVWRLVHSTHSIGSIVAGSVGNSGNNGIPTHTETFAAAMRTKTTQSRSLTYLGASIAALTSFLALYMTHHYLEGTEGIQRAVSFYSLAIPKYIVYRYHQLVQSPDHVWERLDQETSQQGLDIILRLKGFYIKCGQMCASNIGNAFPIVWQETMSILQDQVPPEDFQTVILPIIQSELPNYQQIFSYIDPIPIGSASIGQVHRAKMIIHHNSNNNQETKDVVIKICYPHVERLLRGDVRTIRSFCEIAQPVHVPAMREVEKAFSTEFDYVQEANNLYEVRSNLIRAGLCQSTSPDDSDNSIVHPTAICTVPYPYRQYCTKRVLVMEEIHGDKLVDVLKRDGPRWMEWATRVESMKRSKSTATSTTTTATATISGSDDDIRRSSSSSSSSKHNQRITTEEYERYLSIMDTSRRIQNATNRIYNSTIGWVKGIRLPYQLASELPLNPSKLVDDLMLIHGHQVLVDGRFNADCHPGTTSFSILSCHLMLRI